MKIKDFILLNALFFIATGIKAQYNCVEPLKEKNPVVHGRSWLNEVPNSYTRLPEKAKDKVRNAVWNLSTQSAGLSVKFYSNASDIKVRYVVTGGKSMPHMPSTGVSGVDLYATDCNGKSRWCAANYSFGDTVVYNFRGLAYQDGSSYGYEYQLFLPLYNTVTWLEICTPASSYFRFIPVSKEKPIVVYGTSIAQGACASRPGMAWANIVGRTLEYPLINLGFSGNGLLEPELFELLSEIDARAYVIDCMPNLNNQKDSANIYPRTLAGVKKLREHSNAPILLVEHSGYTNELSAPERGISYRRANKELKRAYEALLKENVSNIFYLSHSEIGLTMDAMVEGVHPSDLGMQQYADAYCKKLREILHENIEGPSTCKPCKQQRDFYDWNERHEQVLERNKQIAPEILMIGNSITHFWGGEPASSRCYGGKTWKNLFGKRKVINLGFGWDKIENVLWRIYHGELNGYQAKYICLMIGTNNLQFNTNDEILRGITRIVEAIKERQPETKINLIGILPRKGMENRIKELNLLVSENLGKEKNVRIVDLSPVLTLNNGLIDNTLFIDGLHPNEKGYERMVKELKPLLK